MARGAGRGTGHRLRLLACRPPLRPQLGEEEEEAGRETQDRAARGENYDFVGAVDDDWW